MEDMTKSDLRPRFVPRSETESTCIPTRSTGKCHRFFPRGDPGPGLHSSCDAQKGSGGGGHLPGCSDTHCRWRELLRHYTLALVNALLLTTVLVRFSVLAYGTSVLIVNVVLNFPMTPDFPLVRWKVFACAVHRCDIGDLWIPLCLGQAACLRRPHRRGLIAS